MGLAEGFGVVEGTEEGEASDDGVAVVAMDGLAATAGGGVDSAGSMADATRVLITTSARVVSRRTTSRSLMAHD